jgi:hypothetical protein
MPRVKLSGPEFKVVTGGLGRITANDQGVSALIFHGYSAPTAPTAFGTAPRRVESLSAAEALGITSAWQLSSTQVTHYHISEFYRLAPRGELWVIFVPVGDVRTTAQLLNELQRSAGGRIRRFGHVNSYGVDLAAGLISALDTDADSLLAQQRPAYSVVETNVIGALADARRFIVKIAAQDDGVLRAISSTPTGTKPAWVRNASCIGTYLGIRAGYSPNQSAGKVSTKDLTAGSYLGGAVFQQPAFTDEVLVSSLDIAALENRKGDQVIMLRTFTDYPGVYFEDDYTQTLYTNLDFRKVANIEVLQSALRRVRTAIIPFVNSEVTLTTSGSIDPATAEEWQAAGQSEIRAMIAAGELSGGRVSIDTESDIVISGNINGEVQLQLRPNAEYFTIKIGFTATIS